MIKVWFGYCWEEDDESLENILKDLRDGTIDLSFSGPEVVRIEKGDKVIEEEW